MVLFQEDGVAVKIHIDVMVEVNSDNAQDAARLACEEIREALSGFNLESSKVYRYAIARILDVRPNLAGVTFRQEQP